MRSSASSFGFQQLLASLISSSSCLSLLPLIIIHFFYQKRFIMQCTTYDTVHRERQVEELTFVQRLNIIPNSIRFNYPILAVVGKLSRCSHLHLFWQQVQLWSEHDRIDQKILCYYIHVRQQSFLKHLDVFSKDKCLCIAHRCYSKVRFTLKTSYFFAVISIATTLNVKKSLRLVLYFFLGGIL